VYRALDFLLEHGLIHKVERLNAFIGCTDTGHGHGHDHAHPHQFLICRTCGATAEIADHAVSHAIESAARGAGFTLSEATVEIEGTCARCAAA
jgi:Fur family zinc uptake transcriptional regulator